MHTAVEIRQRYKVDSWLSEQYWVVSGQTLSIERVQKVLAGGLPDDMREEVVEIFKCYQLMSLEGQEMTDVYYFDFVDQVARLSKLNLSS